MFENAFDLLCIVHLKRPKISQVCKLDNVNSSYKKLRVTIQLIKVFDKIVFYHKLI